MPIYKESNNMYLGEFISQRITNIYVSEIYMGDPPQMIPGFLKPNKYGFTLTNYECPRAIFYYKDKSKTFKYATNRKDYNCLKISESLFFYSSLYSTNYDIQVKNYTVIADNQLSGPECFHIGTQLLVNQDEKETNIMDELHKKKYIKSYFYEYKIYNEDEIYLILGLEDNFEKNEKFKFIKPMIIPYSYHINLNWGLIFQNLYLNNYNNTYGKETKVEFDINCGCLLGNSDFKEYFKNYLKYNGINIEPKLYEKEYYIYFFEKNMTNFDVIKNINLEFYHKELNYYFSFNYDDLILEKRNGYYFLITFEYYSRSSWKFGFPFFKKYHFIFNHDSKLMGFYCPNGCSNNIPKTNNSKNDFNNDNNSNNKTKKEKNNMENNTSETNKNNDNENKENNENKTINKIDNRKFAFKIIIIIVLTIILIVAAILSFGIFIGKKMFGVRKTKVNELLELYDYSET